MRILLMLPKIMTWHAICLMVSEEKRRHTMTDCKWMLDEICVNDKCPMVADYCPVADVGGVCRFEDREDGGADNV